MLATHYLSNYIYYWDHPFLGWATIAAWASLTDGFARDARSVMVGRELMWIATLVSCVLLYVLARRIDIQRPFAAAAVVLFGASPLDIWYHRMVSLDNLATVWALAALVLAASRRRSWGAAIGSGTCFAIAFWNKETILLLFPAMLWLLYQHTDPSTRFANISSFCVVGFSGIAFYPLLAILKGELLPGPGHDSLWREQVVYQLTRPGTGSVLSKHSGTYLQFHSWLVLDSWLVLGGGAICTGLVIRRLRPFALALLLQFAVMVKGGYVPYAFVTTMLPFAALLIAGTADAWWRPIGYIRRNHRRGLSRLIALGVRNVGKVPVMAAAVLAVLIVPHWYGWLDQQSTYNGFAPGRRGGLMGRPTRAQERPGGVRRLSMARHQASYVGHAALPVADRLRPAGHADRVAAGLPGHLVPGAGAREPAHLHRAAGAAHAAAGRPGTRRSACPHSRPWPTPSRCCTSTCPPRTGWTAT